MARALQNFAMGTCSASLPCRMKRESRGLPRTDTFLPPIPAPGPEEPCIRGELADGDSRYVVDEPGIELADEVIVDETRVTQLAVLLPVVVRPAPLLCKSAPRAAGSFNFRARSSAWY